MKITTKLLPLVLVFAAVNASAEGKQTFEKKLLTSNSVGTGAIVKYNYTIACFADPTDCGSVAVTDTLPAHLEIVSCSEPNGATTVQCTAGGQDVEITHPALISGSSFSFDVVTRVKFGVAGGTEISSPATSTIGTPSDPANGAVESTAAIVTVEPPTMHWELKKDRVSPSINLKPTWDTDVRYTVQLCSLTAEGNASINNVQLIDTIPVNAVVVDLGGGVQAGNDITWDLGNLDLVTLYAGADYGSEVCISKTYTLTYPQASFTATNDTDGTPIKNVLKFTGEPVDTQCDPNSVSADGSCASSIEIDEVIGIPTPGAGLSKSAPDILSGSTPMTWTINANVDSSNAPVPDLVVYEQIPVLPANIEAIDITSGQWSSPATTNAPAGSNVQANIAYSTDATACNDAATTFPNSLAANLSSPAAVEVYALPVGTTCVRWEFTDIAADGPAVPRGWSFTTSPILRQKTDTVAGPYPVPVENCLLATYTEFDGSTGTSGPSCVTALIEDATPEIYFQKTQVSGGSSVKPGAEVQYRLRIQHDQHSSTGATINPVIADLLPPEFEFVSWDNNIVPAGKALPNMEKIENYNGTGQTLLRFSWADNAPANSIQIDGSAGIANSESFEETEIADVFFTVKIKAGTLSGSYSNKGVFFDNSPRLTCRYEGTDTDDLDGDGDVAEKVCEQTSSLSVISAAVVSGAKWVKGDPTLPHLNDPIANAGGSDALCPDNGDGFTRFPCVAQTQHGGDFIYLLELTNEGNVVLDNYIVYDILPAIGDVGNSEVLYESNRNTTWVGTLKEALIPADNYTTAIMAQAGSVIEYSMSTDPCRPELSTSSTENPWQTNCTNDWVGSVADFSQVKAFRVKVAFTDAPHWEPAKSLKFTINMQAPASGLPTIPGNVNVFNPSWNSIGHRAMSMEAIPKRLTGEPRKVGIVLPSGYRLGNLVWFDTNSDGIANDGEAGVPNVELILFKDSDGTAGASAGDTQLGTTSTDADGHYSYGGLAEGNYYVMVKDPATQTALNGYVSSSQGEEADPNLDGDNNDNGINTATVGVMTGLVSGVVTLGPGDSEPVDETLRSGNATDDDADAYPDALSNKSVDFGFRQLFDMGDAADPAYPTLDANNGAKHKLGSNVYLGSCVDGEADGQQSADAKGDDGAEGAYTVGTCFQKDDEDGVTFPELIQGEAADLTIFANADCKLNAWIDWNGNGDWADAGDQIAADIDLVAGENTLNIAVPEGGTEAPTAARFRCSTTAGLGFTGLANDGEVEDYLITTKLKLADLELVKKASVEKALAGEEFTYTLILKNTGEGKAKGVVVKDVLPVAQVAFVSANPVGEFDDATGNWTIPLLLPNESKTLEILVKVLDN